MSSQTTLELPPALRAWTRLLRASAATRRLLSARLHAEHGLTISDYETLTLLAAAEEGRLRRIDLAERLLLTPSGVTRLLEGLEGAGLVTRAACAADRRVTYAEITDAGRARLESASCEHVAAVRALFEEHLAPEELDALVGLLERLPGVAEHGDDCPAAGPS